MINYIITKLKNQKVRYRELYHYYCLIKYKRKIVIPFDENWFKGKSVAIIGGADSLLKEKQGEYIDSFDVVVRVNNGIRVIDKYSDYIGRRTSFLFHSFFPEYDEETSSFEVDLWKEQNVEQLIFSYNEDYVDYGRKYSLFFLKKTKRKYSFSTVSYNQTVKNVELVKPTNPTTGIIAINTVLSCVPSLIYLTGITFFRTSHFQDYRVGKKDEWLAKFAINKSHDPDIEYRAFKELYYANTTIFKLDSTLQAIIDNDES